MVHMMKSHAFAFAVSTLASFYPELLLPVPNALHSLLVLAEPKSTTSHGPPVSKIGALSGKREVGAMRANKE
jgi:hypothetical protein